MKQLTFTRVMKKIFYGFTAQTPYPFLQIDVPSLSLFRTLRGLFLDDNLNPHTRIALDAPLRNKEIPVFEANIDPMLRFLHAQNIQPCGWVRIKDGLSSVTEDSDTAYVIECDYEQVVPTAGPRVSAPFLTASWDIECFSMTGDFPVANRTWSKPAKDLMKRFAGKSRGDDAVAQIIASLSFGQDPPFGSPLTPIYCQLPTVKGKPAEMVIEGIKENIRRSLEGVVETIQTILMTAADHVELEELLNKTLRRHVSLQGDPVIQIGTTLTRGGDPTQHLFVFPDCAPIDDIVIHAYPTEATMIMGWFDWMVKQNPDILIGYNVFGFDESYLWQRAEALRLITDSAVLHQMTRLLELGSCMKLEEKFLSSSAMGDNRMYIWSTHGRLQIDMFHYIKRNHVLPS